MIRMPRHIAAPYRKSRAAEKAEDRRGLRQPQPFPLTGDGLAMERVWNRQSCMVLVDRCDLAAAIAEARYRDWLAAELKRRRGERVARALAEAKRYCQCRDPSMCGIISPFIRCRIDWGIPFGKPSGDAP